MKSAYKISISFCIAIMKFNFFINHSLIISSSVSISFRESQSKPKIMEQRERDPTLPPDIRSFPMYQEETEKSFDKSSKSDSAEKERKKVIILKRSSNSQQSDKTDSQSQKK